MLKTFIEELLNNTNTKVDGVILRMYMEDGRLAIEVGEAPDKLSVVCVNNRLSLEEMIISAFMLFMKNKLSQQTT